MENYDLNRNCVSCEYKCDIFELLTDNELELVNSNRSSAYYKPKETIFKQGAPASHVIFLIKGLVKVYIEGVDSKEHILAISKPSQYITGPGLYYNNRYNYSAQAITGVVCCFVEGKVFKQLVEQNRDFSNGFISEFCRRSVNTIESVVHLTQHKMPGRLAKALLYLSESVYESESFELQLTNKELGDLSAMTRESVVRILNELKSDKVVEVVGSTYTIIDKDKLRKIARLG